MNLLLIGGNGLLGTELRKLKKLNAPSHSELDILDIKNPPPADIVIHAAAYTNVEKAETDKDRCFEVNVKGTLNLLQAYPNTPFVYISSEYAHTPVNFYALTKSLAEQLVTYHTAPYLIIRTLFKKRPWQYEYAFQDKWTLGDYVDVISEKVMKEIEQWDLKSKLIYIGTGRKTYYDLARETKVDVKPNSVHDISNVKIPPDYK